MSGEHMGSQMDSDVGSAVGGAALGGLALGLARQFQNNNAAEWQAYSQQLQTQIQNLQDELARANFAADTRGKFLKESEAEKRQLHDQLQHTQRQLKQSQDQLRLTSADLAQQSTKLTEITKELAKSRDSNEAGLKKVAALNGLVDYYQEKRSDLQKRLICQSASTFAVTTLYNRLVEEIQNAGDPGNFEALGPRYVLKVVTEEWDHYYDTGDMVYRPRLSALSASQQEEAFGGMDRPEAGTNSATPPQPGSPTKP
jgi:hypothetical protein